MGCAWRLILVISFFWVNPLRGDNIAFITDVSNNIVYSFDPDHTSTPAVSRINSIEAPDCIAFSPDGQTVYFTSFRLAENGGDVYSFPAQGPYVPVALGIGVNYPVGVAISSDGSTGYVLTDNGTRGIFSFSTGGSNHVATRLTATDTVIIAPMLVVVHGDTLYVGQFESTPGIFSATVSGSSYTATRLQTTDSQVSGIAVSNDGYLYFAVIGGGGLVYRVPLSSPTDTPTLVMEGIHGYLDGIAVSRDSKTLFATALNYGVYSVPTDQGFPQTASLLSELDVPSAWALAIIQGASIQSPTNLVGFQKTNNFGIASENFNVLQWDPSPSDGVTGYFVYRNSVKIATLSATTLQYHDHNRPEAASTSYSVTAFNHTNQESTAVDVDVS